jgi:hypothetical protein
MPRRGSLLELFCRDIHPAEQVIEARVPGQAVRPLVQERGEGFRRSQALVEPDHKPALSPATGAERGFTEPSAAQDDGHRRGTVLAKPGEHMSENTRTARATEASPVSRNLCFGGLGTTHWEPCRRALQGEACRPRTGSEACISATKDRC